MSITTIAEARALVGRTFERDGEKVRIANIIVHFSRTDWTLQYVSEFAMSLSDFLEVFAEVTEVSDA